ncbi:hypothetical protein B0O80DRAFT_261869 [Mortierella sp. GBAus27b]|nr:hypothetical protein B0O80DRAFT_261869 [Mortierella sp. GBAus27b]
MDPSSQSQDLDPTAGAQSHLNQSSDGNVVIAVEQRAAAPSYVFPARKDDSDRISIDCDDQAQRPASPPFRGDPSPAFRYLGRSLRGDYTPSVRSTLLPGHQQSSRPYTSSYRNDYHPPLGGHRFDGHPHGYRDMGKLLSIDYAGLDAAVTEASLIENGFQKPNFVEPISSLDAKDSKALDRAASTGSSFQQTTPPILGATENEFRRRSARKASFYSERAPRVSNAHFH